MKIWKTDVDGELRTIEAQIAAIQARISELAGEDERIWAEIAQMWNAIQSIPKGEKGDKGDTGPQGPKGDKGDKGEKGDTGDNIIERDYDDSALRSSIAALEGRVTNLENSTPDLSEVNSDIASLNSRMSSLESQVLENNSAIINMRQDVDLLNQTINSAINVAVVDANGNATTIKVLQSATGDSLMTTIYYYDVASQTMNEAKVFSNRVNKLVTLWKPTEIAFVLPSGESAKLKIFADQSTLESLGKVFQAEPCEVCEDGETQMKYFLTPAANANPEGN